MIYIASLQPKSIEDKLEGCDFITNLEELNNVLVNTTEYSTIQVREDFARQFFNCSFLENYIETFYKLNPAVRVEFDFDYENYKFDAGVRRFNDCLTLDDILNLLVIDKGAYNTLQTLLEHEADHMRILMGANTDIAVLQETIIQKDAEIARLKSKLETTEGNLTKYVSLLNSIINNLSVKHGANINLNNVNKQSSHNYKHVLYIKEITRIQYIDTLIEQLADIYTIINGVAARSMVIEGEGAYGNTRLYPKHKSSINLTQEDILGKDILVYGNQYEVIRDVLKNGSMCGLLIILDRSGYDNVLLDADDVTYIYTASDIDDLPAGVTNGNAITYSQSTLRIPYIEEWDALSHAARRAAYSDSFIVKNLLERIS